MTATFIWLLPTTQLRTCTAGEIALSLTRLQKHRSELKFFVSIFRKPEEINIYEIDESENVPKMRDFFVTSIAHA